MTLLWAVLCLASVMVVGWLLSTLLGVKKGLEKAGLSFIIGSWLLTLEMMISYQIVGIFSWWMIVILLVASSFILLLLIYASPARSELMADSSRLTDLLQHPLEKLNLIKSRLQALNNLELALLLLIVGLLGYTALSNFVWPISDWDAIALYDFRAQLIRLVGNWRDGKALGYFYQYPPYTSLLHGALYLFGFERVKVVYTVLFSSFLVLFYQFLRIRVSRSQSLLGCFLVTIAPLVWPHITIAYTNLPYTIFLTLSILYAWKWLEQKSLTDALLSLLLLAGSTWIRQSEPFWLVTVGLLIIGAVQVKSVFIWKILGIAIVLFIGILQYWPLYLQSLQLPPPPVSVNDAIYSVPITLATLTHHFFLVTNHVLIHAVKPVYMLLIPVVLLLIFDTRLSKENHTKVVYVTLGVMMLLIYAGTYYFSFTYSSWAQIGESLSRLVMVMVPLFIYVISLSTFWALILKKKPKRQR